MDTPQPAGLSAEELERAQQDWTAARDSSGYSMGSLWAMSYGPRLIAEVRAARQHSAPSVGRELRIVFDAFPGHERPGFIEVENEHGGSFNAGEWRARSDGYVELVILPLPPAGDRVLRSLLADYDRAVSVCPINQPNTPTGRGPCKVCGATARDNCGRDATASYLFIKAAREALAQTGETEAQAGEDDFGTLVEAVRGILKPTPTAEGGEPEALSAVPRRLTPHDLSEIRYQINRKRRVDMPDDEIAAVVSAFIYVCSRYPATENLAAPIPPTGQEGWTGWRSACCEGERCYCGAEAAHKVEERIFRDDPHQHRHPFTRYVCHAHFVQIMGHAADKGQG